MAISDYIPGSGYSRYMIDEVAKAKKKGGIPAAVGMGARIIPGGVVAAGADILDATGKMAEPILRPFAQTLKTLVTGDPTLIGQEPPATPTGAVAWPATRVQPVDLGQMPQVSREPAGMGAVAPAGQFTIPSGGFLRNNTTGATYNFGAYQPATGPASIAVPQNINAAGGFALGALGLKNIAGDNAQKVAEAKFNAEQATKLPGAQKDAFSVWMAREHLKANPGDLAGAAAILSGKSDSSTVSIPQGFMGDFSKDVPVITTKGPGAGTIKLTTPQRGAISEANINASMQEKGLTREQAKQAYKTAGYDISQIK